MAKMLIGGELVDSGSNDRYEVRNPATSAVVDTAPKGNERDVQQAIQAAETALKEWADTTAEERGHALMNACELIKKNSGEIAQLLTQEQGKTLFEAGLEIHHLVHGLEFYAGLASKVRGAHVPLPQKGAYGMVLRQPIGVCGGIVPWNFPLTLMGTKLGPALAAVNDEGPPVVHTLHGRLDLPDLAPLYQEFMDVPVVSISDAQRAPLPGVNWQGTVYHGLPEELYTFRPEPGTYLAFLGRISPEKRVDRAIAIAQQIGMDLKIAAKVDPVDREYFEAAIAPLLRAPRVEYIGEIGEGEKSEFLGQATARQLTAR